MRKKEMSRGELFAILDEEVVPDILEAVRLGRVFDELDYRMEYCDPQPSEEELVAAQLEWRSAKEKAIRLFRQLMEEKL